MEPDNFIEGQETFMISVDSSDEQLTSLGLDDIDFPAPLSVTIEDANDGECY